MKLILFLLLAFVIATVADAIIEHRRNNARLRRMVAEANQKRVAENATRDPEA
jgi:hypothetical protein